MPMSLRTSSFEGRAALAERLMSNAATKSAAFGRRVPDIVSVERLAFGSEAREQRRGLPEGRIAVGILRELAHALHHVREPVGIGVEHRPAAKRGKAIA